MRIGCVLTYSSRAGILYSIFIFISSVGDFLCVSVFLCTCQQRGSHVQVINKPKLGVYAFILKRYWRDLRALLPWRASFCFWSQGGCQCVAITCTFMIVLVRPFLSSGKSLAGNKTQWAIKGWGWEPSGLGQGFHSVSVKHICILISAFLQWTNTASLSHVPYMWKYFMNGTNFFLLNNKTKPM